MNTISLHTLTPLVGAAVLSLFVVANLYAMYLYLRRHLALAPGSTVNHAITARFDSPAEIDTFHAQADAETHARANAALGRYQQIFQQEREKLDPLHARHYPTPDKTFAELL